MAVSTTDIEQRAGRGSTLIFEETTPPSIGVARKLVLRGGGLPFMGAEWGTELAMSTTFYPGNRVGTQQILGARVSVPSAWQGRWSRVLLGEAPALYTNEFGDVERIVNPLRLREVVEDLQFAGTRLRVTWSLRGESVYGQPSLEGEIRNDDFKIVREGALKSFKVGVDRAGDLTWNMELQWVSRGEKQQRVASIRADTNIAKSSDELVASLSSLLETINTAIRSSFENVRRSANQATLGLYDQFTGRAVSAGDVLSNALDESIRTFRLFGEEVGLSDTTQPVSTANTTINFAADVGDSCRTFGDSIKRTPAELFTEKTDVTGVLRASSYFFKVDDASDENAQRASDLDARVRKAMASQGNSDVLTGRDQRAAKEGDFLAVHTCGEKETPISLSVRFYSSPDFAEVIMRTNRLPEYTPSLRPGQILLIPTLNNAAAQRRC